MSILMAIFSAVLELIRLALAQRNEVATLQQMVRTLQDQLSGQGLALTTLQTTVDFTQSEIGEIKNLLFLSPAVEIRIPATVEGHTTNEGETVNLTDSQKGTLGPIEVLDAKKQPATLDGVPVWASSDETIATVLASDDGLSADVVAVRPGTCTVTVTGDADLGAGVIPIVGTSSINVTPGQAVQVTIPEGVPVDQ